MGYRRALLFRWSRRDKLAVLVVAVTVGFLTGATLLGLALGAQTTSIAEDYSTEGGVSYHASLDAANAAAGPDEVVLPLTRVGPDGPDGPDARYVIGVPDPAPTLSVGGSEIGLPTPPPDTLLAEDAVDSEVRAVGPDGERRLSLGSRSGGTLIPGDWYVASADTVADLGPTGALVLSEKGTPAIPFVTALWFFVLGTRQLIELLLLAVAASGVLVLVTVYSVTRITVGERRDAVGVIRATGGSPGRVLSLFGLRALLLSAVGAVAGYALGMILVRLVLNAAVFAGLPVSLDVRITGRAISVLAPAVVGIALVGALAGVLAALPVVRCPPARIDRPGESPPRSPGRSGSVGGRLRRALDTTVLGWDALVPTAATLSVFVAFLLLVAAIGGVLAPLASADEGTITAPDAEHPFASTVPTVYADALRDQGARASPEIMLLEVNDGRPYLARGVNYTAYRSLSDVRVVEGRAPESDGEAVVGSDLARTLSVGVGDSITLGGTTRPGFSRVEIVGRFAGAGSQDDQLLVSLPVAQHLAGKSEGSVQFVRTDWAGRDGAGGAGSTVAVVDARASSDGNGTTISLDLRNYGLSESTATVDVRVANRTRSVRATVPARRRGEATVTVPRLSPGTYRLTAGDFATNLTVGSGGPGAGLSVTVPDRAPTGSSPLVLVRNGTARANATLTVVAANGSRRTFVAGDDGAVRVDFPTAGEYEITARAPGGDGTARRAAATVAVGDGYARPLVADLRITPSSPSVVTRPRAAATLRNPWEENATRRVAIVGPSSRTERTVALAPGASTRAAASLPRRPAGTYEVAVLEGERELATVEYAVRGDERLAAALASSGRRSAGGGLARAASVAFGNIEVLLVSLIALTALMTIGGTTASFTRAIRAKRGVIGVRRATGATPRDVFRLVLGDALRIGCAATALALVVAAGALTGLLAAGRLRVFGVTLQPSLSPGLLAGAGAAALGLALLSAAAATAALIRRPPAALLADARGGRIPDGPGRRAPGASDAPDVPDSPAADGGAVDGRGGSADE